MAYFFRILLLFLTFFPCSVAPLGAMERDSKDDEEKIDNVSLALGLGALAYLAYHIIPNPWSEFSRDEDNIISKKGEPKSVELCLAYNLVEKNRIVHLTDKQRQGKSTVAVGDQEKKSFDIVQCNVVGQSGATCAYHALKNGLYISMLPFVAENDTASLQCILSLLTSQKEVSRLIGYSSPWWKAAGERAWLDTGEIEFGLIKYENENKNILQAHQLKAENITVVENTDNIATPVLDEAFLPLCNNMRNAETSLVHIFVVGNMTQYSEKQGSQGHWYTLVVNKVGNKIQFLVSDSLGGSRLDDTKIKKIITYLLEADCKPIAERHYFNNDINSLLDLAVQYISDEYSIGEYSRQEREKGIWEKIKKIRQNFTVHKDEITTDTFVKPVTAFVETLQTITTSNNYNLVCNFKTYMDCLLDMRKRVNTTAHLQEENSDDFDVPLKMWFIVQKMQKSKSFVSSSSFKKVALLKRSQKQLQEQSEIEIVCEGNIAQKGQKELATFVKPKNAMPEKELLVDDIRKKVNAVKNQQRKNYGLAFLKEINNGDKADPEKLLKLVSLYVNA